MYGQFLAHVHDFKRLGDLFCMNAVQSNMLQHFQTPLGITWPPGRVVFTMCCPFATCMCHGRLAPFSVGQTIQHAVILELGTHVNAILLTNCTPPGNGHLGTWYACQGNSVDKLAAWHSNFLCVVLLSQTCATAAWPHSHLDSVFSMLM